MTEDKKNKLIVGSVVGLMLLGTAGIWAAATWWPTQSTPVAGEIPVTPVPTAVVKISPRPSPVVVDVTSPRPTPKASSDVSPKPSPTAKPSVSPSPSVSPLPSLSPSPATNPNLDLNLEKAVFSLSKCESGSTTINMTSDLKTYEYPSSSNYCVGAIDIRNNGQEDASNVEVKILLNNEIKANTTIDKIEKQSAKSVDLKYLLPGSTGEFTIKVQVNPAHSPLESRYDNNEVGMKLKMT